MNRLYYLRIDDIEGNSRDLMVVAVTPEAAAQFWRDYYEDPAEDFEDDILVWQVPTDLSTAGAVNWGNINVAEVKIAP